MTPVSRRRALAIAGSTTVATFAGCIDALSTADDASDANSNLPDDALTDESVVNYPEFVDGDATVDDAGDRIEYVDPETVFHVEAIVDGDEPAGDDLRVTRTLADDAMTVFLAPEYDDGFTYHVFANEAFVADADWSVVVVDDDGYDDHDADFESVHEGVSYLEVAPETDVRGVAVADQLPNPEEPDDDELTAVAIGSGLEAQTPAEEQTPAVSIEFDQTADGTVDIMHMAGDVLDGENVVVLIGDEEIENPFETESVAAGDTATIEDRSEGETVRLVYEDDGSRTVLDEYTVG